MSRSNIWCREASSMDRVGCLRRPCVSMNLSSGSTKADRRFSRSISNPGVQRDNATPRGRYRVPQERALLAYAACNARWLCPMKATRALEALNFFVADAQAGIGPFLGVFLQARGWGTDMIGTVMTIGIVRQRGFDRQFECNQVANHAGNVVAAALSGWLGWRYGFGAVFALSVAFGILSLIAVAIDPCRRNRPRYRAWAGRRRLDRRRSRHESERPAHSASVPATDSARRGARAFFHLGVRRSSSSDNDVAPPLPSRFQSWSPFDRLPDERFSSLSPDFLVRCSEFPICPATSWIDERIYQGHQARCQNHRHAP